MDKTQLKIVFFGTPEFAVTSLDALVTEGYNIRAVVTMPDKVAGRGHKLIESDVKKYAVKKGIPVLQPANLKEPAFIQQLRDIDADLFIVIAFRMMPEIVWSMPRFGTFNLHASLLPCYRGAAPINRAVMNGEKTTGVTTFFLKHEIDTGDIIAQEEIKIEDNENAGSVHDRLMNLGASMVLKTVNEIVTNDGNIEVKPQPDGDFIPAPKIFAETCVINWNQESEIIRNQIRGLSPYPAAKTTILNEAGQEFSLKIFEAHKVSTDILRNAQPGEIEITKNKMYVKCLDAPLEIKEVQLQGKKRMPIEAFLLGFHPKSLK